jgi:hypothetical protein
MASASGAVPSSFSQSETIQAYIRCRPLFASEEAKAVGGTHWATYVIWIDWNHRDAIDGQSQCLPRENACLCLVMQVIVDELQYDSVASGGC